LISKLLNKFLKFSLVICIKNEIDLLKIIFQLFDYLRFSGNLIVFSREIEPLVALERILYEEKFAIDNRIHETFLREFQVLPMRTHPMMNNKGFSGYVLTGIKAINTKRD
jgi:tRNA (adenine-N(1)-)-methyltransferase non-catalytic subunit